MSIIDELMILLDENGQLSIEDIRAAIPNRTFQIISSSLGRLQTRGWVKSSKNQSKIFFEITQAGSNEVTQTLSEIKKINSKTWNGSWQIVVFNIPERERFRRDTLRQKIEKLGFGRIENSLWLSPRDNSSYLDKIIHDLKIKNYVTYFNTGKLNSEESLKISQKFQWDWPGLDKKYRDFIFKAKNFIAYGKKNVYNARLLVYYYAKILLDDPKFPESINPKDYLGQKAFSLYNKIRPYCYNK